MLSRGGRSTAIADVASAVTLGTSPTVARARRASAVQGRQFAHEITSSGSASVNRLEHRFAEGAVV
jgi:hypothetical protein